MNKEIKGRVEDIQERISTKNNKTYFFIKLAGVTLFDWDNKTQGLKVGDLVSVIHDGNEYAKIIEIYPITESDLPKVQENQTDSVDRSHYRRSTLAVVTVKEYREELKTIFKECLEDALEALPKEYSATNHAFVVETAKVFFEKRARPQYFALK